LILYTASLITRKNVIHAKAGIQKGTGFRIKPGMTNCIRPMSPCIIRQYLARTLEIIGGFGSAGVMNILKI
jgi:hypothetical protein